MTAEPEESRVHLFFQTWSEAFVAVLGQLGVASISSSLSELAAADPPGGEERDKSVSAAFSVGGKVKSQLLWITEPRSAVQLAQLLLSEVNDPAAEFTATHSDAFGELLRQVAGHAATAWKGETGGETEFAFESSTQAENSAGQSGTLLLESEQMSAITLRLFLSGKLCQELLAAKETPSPAVATRTETAPRGAEKVAVVVAENVQLASQGAAATGLPPNLDLLLDVELDATIRFGERSMLLRDVFTLMPGAVVELNQQVNDPAELLVAGRLIARGEVVIVDGNFGLRVTTVVSPGQRAALLQI